MREDEREWMVGLLAQRWGGTLLARRGAAVPLESTDAVLALVDGEPAGVATYAVTRGEVEVVTLDALVERIGVGSALLESVAEVGRAAGCVRLWLITTNENLDAVGFYVRRGLRVAAVHLGAVASARLLKPTIPLRDERGVAVEDELELERWL